MEGGESQVLGQGEQVAALLVEEHLDEVVVLLDQDVRLLRRLLELRLVEQ